MQFISSMKLWSISILAVLFSLLSQGQVSDDNLQVPKKEPGIVHGLGSQGKITDLSKLQDNKDKERQRLKYLFQDRKQEPKNLRVIQGPGTSGGGGDVVICGKYRFRLFSDSEYQKYYLADTLDLFTNGVLDNSEAIPEEIWMEAIFKTLNDSDLNSTQGQKLGDLVRSRLQELQFTLVEDELPELDDDQIDLSKVGCEEKKQLAIQDLKTGEVRVNTNLLRELSFTEIYFFKVHEALISLKKTVDDTTPIRQELRNTIEKIKLENVLKQVSQNYIELPQSLRYLWALKVLYKNEFLIKFSRFRGQCKFEQQAEALSRECFASLLSWVSSYDNWDEVAFRSIGSSYYFALIEAGFLPRAPNQPHLYGAIKGIGHTANLVYVASQYFNPRNMYLRKDQIDLSEVESTHVYIIQALRNTYWESVLGYPVDLISVLNNDFEKFRQKLLQDKYVPLTDLISEDSDRWFSSIGSCYYTKNIQNYQRKSGNVINVSKFIKTLVSPKMKFVSEREEKIDRAEEFLSCLKAKQISVEKKNENQSNDEFKLNLETHFENNFQKFIEFLQQNTIIKE